MTSLRLAVVPFLVVMLCCAVVVAADATATRPTGGAISSRSATSTTRAAKAPVPPLRRDVPGRRESLSTGVLYVPDFFTAKDADHVDVVVWFLGSSWCTEQTFYDARRNAVLITVNVKDFAVTFRDPQALPRILDDATAWMKREGITDRPVRHVCLASFSGGCSAVREILKQRESLRRVTDVVLADSLYAPRVEGTKDQLAPDAMAPFLEYASRAAKGECTFWFSHLYPPEEQHRGNTTTLTASYLIDHLKAERHPASGQNSRGAKLLYRADLGQFHVLGYAGMTTQDHFEHFYAAGDLLRNTSLDKAR